MFLGEVNGFVGEERISRDDLEGAVQRMIGDPNGEKMSRPQLLTLVAGLALLGVAALAYSFGRRKGHLSAAVVEVRRL